MSEARYFVKFILKDGGQAELCYESEQQRDYAFNNTALLGIDAASVVRLEKRDDLRPRTHYGYNIQAYNIRKGCRPGSKEKETQAENVKTASSVDNVTEDKVPPAPTAATYQQRKMQRK